MVRSIRVLFFVIFILCSSHSFASHFTVQSITNNQASLTGGPTDPNLDKNNTLSTLTSTSTTSETDTISSSGNNIITTSKSTSTTGSFTTNTDTSTTNTNTDTNTATSSSITSSYTTFTTHLLSTLTSDTTSTGVTTFISSSSTTGKQTPDASSKMYIIIGAVSAGFIILIVGTLLIRFEIKRRNGEHDYDLLSL